MTLIVEMGSGEVSQWMRTCRPRSKSTKIRVQIQKSYVLFSIFTNTMSKSRGTIFTFKNIFPKSKSKFRKGLRYLKNDN